MLARLPQHLTALLIAAIGAGCVTRAPVAPAGAPPPAHDHAHAHDHEHEHEHEHAHEHDHAHEHGARGELRDAIAAPHADGDGHARPAPLRTNLTCGWCAPFDHSHRSHCGTPYVHGFLTEPAFLGTDLILGVARGDEETEVEAELEWALTRRLGLIVETAWIDAEERGLGDSAIGVRALLVEERRFLLSVVGELEIPTGSEPRGLSEGHVAIGASLNTWIDLGSWFTLQTVVGIEHVPDEDETELGWGLTLAKSWRARPLICNRACGNAEHHRPIWSLIAEIAGDTALEGEEDTGETEGQWLLGAAYPLAYDVDLRAAFTRTFGGEEDEDAWILGVIVHF